MMRRSPQIAGIALVLVIAAATLFAPSEAARSLPFQPPGMGHPLGTDDVGHDVLAEVQRGGRVSLMVGLAVGLSTIVLGSVIGGLAGIVRRLDAPLMAMVDFLLVIPRLPLVILVSLYLRPGVANAILLLSLLGWPSVARTIRPLVRSVAQAEFVQAARSWGAGPLYLLRRHILPQCRGVLLAQCILEARYGVMAEAGLGFLGLEEPTTKSWGMMMAYAFGHPATFVSDAWTWTVVPPALALVSLTLGLGLIGMGLESRWDPQLGQSAASRPWNPLEEDPV
ncbi:MAG: ABC transporter permease [Bryobacteraceae bacterium]